MSDLETERKCSACGNDTFYLTTSMEIHLGTKMRWHYAECDYDYIHIMDDIEAYAKTEA